MNVYSIIRPDDAVLVTILPNKEDNKYSFVNLTKGHICPCKFDSIEDAIADLDEHVKSGKVIKYKQLEVMNNDKSISNSKP